MDTEPDALRQRGKPKEDKFCGVCGDRALGYNFDAISCESCKAFFRRNAPKSLDSFKCAYEDKCKMDVSNRRFCKRCRLQKCFDIGMRKEYILTDEERQRKRKKIEENKRLRDQDRQPSATTPKDTAMEPMESSPIDSMDESMPSAHAAFSVMADAKMSSPMGMMGGGMGIGQLGGPLGGMPIMPGLGGFPIPATGMNMDVPAAGGFKSLKEEDRLLIEELRGAYRSSLAVLVDSIQPRDESQTGLNDLVNVAEVSIRRVIDMAKKVKSFKALPQPTQICLLKGGSIELLIIRSVLTFDKEKQMFLDSSDTEASAMSINEFKSAATRGAPAISPGMDPAQHYTLVEDIMKFVKTLAVDLRADEIVLVLLLVISLFSPDRPNLDLKEVVTREQEKYSMLLKRYLESRYPHAFARQCYPKLLMKLTDIRNLNEESSKVFLNMNADTIQPLMKEVLDFQPETPTTPTTGIPAGAAAPRETYNNNNSPKG